MEIVEISKSDLRFILRALDTAMSEVEAAVADGLIDSSVLLDMDSATEIVKEAINWKKG